MANSSQHRSDGSAAESAPRVIPYSDDYNNRLLAEIYDQSAGDEEDLALVRRLIGSPGRPLQILEPFAGTGRLCVPLLADGHHVTAIEIAPAMSERALSKARQLGPEALARLKIVTTDALTGGWGSGYDLVVLGGNALYELPAAAAQRRCLELAWEALRRGGRLYVDNNHWRTPIKAELGRKWVGLRGTAADGTYAEERSEVVGVDPADRIMKVRRTWYTRTVDGQEHTAEYIGTKRPVDGFEVSAWLAECDFEIIKVFGDRSGAAFTKDSARAIFWARRP